MSNKSIAINWAQKQVRMASGFVYSDAFFRPFSNQDTHRKIIKELGKANVVVWPDTQGGAFLFRRNDPRLTVVADQGVRVGSWVEGADTDQPKLVLLPAVEDVV